jgi:hypothetical protein
MNDSTLTIVENSRLNNLESMIEKGMKAFYEMGKALREIRDSKLYRLEFSTFEEYCERKWNYKKSQCYQLIGASDVMDNLSAIAEVSPQTESQVRPLTLLKTPEAQQEVWANVFKKHGVNATAKIIQEEVSNYKASHQQQAKENTSLQFRVVGYLGPYHHNLFDRIKNHKETTEADLVRQFINKGIEETPDSYKRPIN